MPLSSALRHSNMKSLYSLSRSMSAFNIEQQKQQQKIIFNKDIIDEQQQQKHINHNDNLHNEEKEDNGSNIRIDSNHQSVVVSDSGQEEIPLSIYSKNDLIPVFTSQLQSTIITTTTSTSTSTISFVQHEKSLDNNNSEQFPLEPSLLIIGPKVFESPTEGSTLSKSDDEDDHHHDDNEDEIKNDNVVDIVNKNCDENNGDDSNNSNNNHKKMKKNKMFLTTLPAEESVSLYLYLLIYLSIYLTICVLFMHIHIVYLL